jgi:hypothetical protein
MDHHAAPFRVRLPARSVVSGGHPMLIEWRLKSMGAMSGRRKRKLAAWALSSLRDDRAEDHRHEADDPQQDQRFDESESPAVPNDASHGARSFLRST